MANLCAVVHATVVEEKHGQFVCGNNDDILVSFDGGLPVPFTCNETQEASETLVDDPVYLDAHDDFVQRMNSATMMSMQPLLFVDGRKGFSFSAPWERLLAIFAAFAATVL